MKKFRDCLLVISVFVAVGAPVVAQSDTVKNDGINSDLQAAVLRGWNTSERSTLSNKKISWGFVWLVSVISWIVPNASVRSLVRTSGFT